MLLKDKQTGYWGKHSLNGRGNKQQHEDKGTQLNLHGERCGDI